VPDHELPEVHFAKLCKIFVSTPERCFKSKEVHYNYGGRREGAKILRPNFFFSGLTFLLDWPKMDTNLKRRIERQRETVERLLVKEESQE
jgi:hypothetical protein